MENIVPVCRWLFEEAGGSSRLSEGKYCYALEEMNDPINRIDDGIVSPYSAQLLEGQWFNLSRVSCPALNFHGKDTCFSLISWIKRKEKIDNECECIAGMWNETEKTRQYCLFLNLGIWDSAEQVCGHLSSSGAPTPDYPYCMEAAIGKSPVSLNQWHQIAFTFDGIWAKVYLDGIFNYRPGLNPYFWPLSINNGGSLGSDFTVGAVYRRGTMGNWFVGQIGGLATYDQVLNEQQILDLFTSHRV